MLRGGKSRAMSLLANMGGGPSYASVPVADPSSSFAALSSGGGHVAAGAAGKGGGSLLSKFAALGLKAKLALAGVAIAVVAGAGAGIAVAVKPPASSGVAQLCSYSNYRLPLNVMTVSNYVISWAPRFSAPFTYSGTTSFDLNFLQAVDCVLVHAGPDLLFSSVTVGASAAAPQTAVAWTPDLANERVVLRLPAAAGASLTLTFTYTSPLRTTNNGLYLSTYVDDNKNTVNMTATQFEATAARQAFPCLDEPAYKANFSMTVDNVPSTYTALSNMPVTSSGASPSYPGTLRVSFAPSPRMSTYLLALVVGPLIKSSASFGAKTVTSYGVDRAATRGQLDFATSVAAKIIPFYETLFNAPFPLPKMDMVSIPDFAAGAMENWGLITYRETALLASNTSSSAAELQRVAVVVSHELAHQWFGDLVTMEWWSSLWLNEGFATKTEYVGVDFSEPQFEISRQYTSTAMYAALRADALADVQQLTSDVDSSAAIEGMFSAISYSKGGSILRQVQEFLASSGLPSAFYAGIAGYIAQNAFGNAQPTTLWSSFAAASGVAPLASWMSTYELRPGFPLVSVSWVNADGGTTGAGALALSQARFFASPFSRSKAAAADAATLWWVPLSFVAEHPSAAVSAAITTAGQCSANALPGCAFTGARYANEITYSIATDGFLKLNQNGSLYHRVAYPANIWTALFASATAQATAGAAGPLSNGDRGQLVDDLFTITEAALPEQLAQGVNTVFALKLAKALLPVERAYEVWVPALNHLSSTFAFLFPDVPLANAGTTAVSPFDGASGAADRACITAFSAAARASIAPLLSSLGNFSNSATVSVPLLVQLQASALNAASFFGDPDVIAASRAFFDGNWTSAPVDFQTAILRSVSRWSTPTDGYWYKLVDEYVTLSALGSTAANRVLGALPATFDRSQLVETLSFAASDAVRVGDKVGLIAGVASNPYGRDLAFKFIEDNWSEWKAASY